MVFLKIIACAFSMGFCLMCVSSLGDFWYGGFLTHLASGLTTL